MRTLKLNTSHMIYQTQTIIIIASDRRSEVIICEIDSVRSCVTDCCEAAR